VIHWIAIDANKRGNETIQNSIFGTTMRTTVYLLVTNATWRWSQKEMRATPECRSLGAEEN